MLSTAPASSHTLFSLRRNEPSSSNDLGDTTTSFDFLPSVSFDDLQSSLESASTDFKLAQFPSPTGQGSILEPSQIEDSVNMPEKSNVTRSGNTTRVVIPQSSAASMATTTATTTATRPGRSGSILRRPSTSSKQGTTFSSASRPPSGAHEAPTAPAAMRPRRQSHYPPVSNSNIVKPPRKSIGPGIIDSDYGARATAHRRRPSLASNTDRTATVTTTTTTTDSARSSIDTSTSASFAGVSSHLTAATRASKARSFQSTTRPNYNPPNSSTLVDNTRAASIAARSPRVPPKGAINLQTNKRVSVMPGMPSPSHLTGLGARTISPTDTRRMKRLSMHHTATQGGNGAQHRTAADLRPSSRSPSMLPRKATATPSSSRTTPDVNRKSYSSGLSVGSNNSYNTVRTSTGSLQPRVPQPGASSRLPAPKPLSVNQSLVPDDDEDVPPVPAIPKVYESPKEPPLDINFIEKKKSSLAQDSSSINSNSTGTVSIVLQSDASSRVQRKGSVRKSSFYPQNGDSNNVRSNTLAHSKKNLAPLRLPPMVLGPISTPTAAKIAALQRKQEQADRDLSSPPPSKMIPKTPTTPMTASKTSFFSRHRSEKVDLPSLRSSSSIQPMRTDSSNGMNPGSSSESLSAVVSPRSSRKPSMSPFLSSSVPQGGGEHMPLKRSKTGTDFATINESLFEAKASSKSSRPPSVKSTAKSPAQSSPEEPPTPSSISALRRKLSLSSWKRGTSKGHIALPPGLVEKPPEYNTRQESMPPPRIPASAIMANFGSTSKPPSPTPSAKASGNYLDSRRRKSSTSSLNTYVSVDRTRVDTWGANTQSVSVKIPINDMSTERLTLSRNSSVMQKILKPKPSTAAMRQPNVWTAELDKDDLIAEEEMRKLGSRRKETEIAARTLDALRKRATPKERVDPHEAIRIAMLNVYERGEIVDYPDVYFCGTQNARKVVGDLHSQKPNFGYDDDRGDYTIVPGDHLAYRYEIIDVLGKGSFGQVVRCIDHCKGALVAVKIIRNKKRFHQQALVEVNILKKLREWVSTFFDSQRPALSTSALYTLYFMCNQFLTRPTVRTPTTSTAWYTLPTTSTSVAIFVSLPSCWI